MLGTLVALNAYLWLLQHTAPALAGSYFLTVRSKIGPGKFKLQINVK